MGSANPSAASRSSPAAPKSPWPPQTAPLSASQTAPGSGTRRRQSQFSLLTDNQLHTLQLCARQRHKQKGALVRSQIVETTSVMTSAGDACPLNRRDGFNRQITIGPDRSAWIVCSKPSNAARPMTRACPRAVRCACSAR